MGAFNMPPGVSTSDIPGNDVPDPSPDRVEVLVLLESAEGRCPPQYYCDKIVEIVEGLVVERNDYKARLEDLQMRLATALDRSVSPEFVDKYQASLLKRQAE